MKLWDNLGRTQKRLAIVAGIIISLGVIGGFANKVIHKWNEYTAVPALVDSLASENNMMWAVLQEFYIDLAKMGFQSEMFWHLHMANTERHDDEDYYVTFMEGSKIDAFVRDDHLDPPEQWVFFKTVEEVIDIDGEMINKDSHHLYQAIWSGVYNKFYYVDLDGDEHLIYKE